MLVGHFNFIANTINKVYSKDLPQSSEAQDIPEFSFKRWDLGAPSTALNHVFFLKEANERGLMPNP